MSRLLLVRHAATEATRRAAFGADGPLTARGRADARRLGERLARGGGAAAAAASPARCAGETAAALGLTAGVDAALADWDLGAWRGRTLDELAAERPDALAAWLEDPAAAPHGGERLLDVLARAAGWLAATARALARGATLVAVTHAAVVRACVVAALDAPARAFWALDVAPLGVTDLRRRDGRWRLAAINGAPA